MSFRSREPGSQGATGPGLLTTTLLLLVFAGPLGAQAPRDTLAPRLPGSLAPSYTPHRVYDTRKKRFIDFDTFEGS